MKTWTSEDLDRIPVGVCITEAAMELSRLKSFLMGHSTLTVAEAMKRYEPIRQEYEQMFMERELAGMGGGAL